MQAAGGLVPRAQDWAPGFSASPCRQSFAALWQKRWKQTHRRHSASRTLSFGATSTEWLQAPSAGSCSSFPPGVQRSGGAAGKRLLSSFGRVRQ